MEGEGGEWSSQGSPWFPTCLAVFVPTLLAIVTLDEGLHSSMASTNLACSAGVHSFVAAAAASSAPSRLASAACWFQTCWPRDLLDGRVSLQMTSNGRVIYRAFQIAWDPLMESIAHSFLKSLL